MKPSEAMLKGFAIAGGRQCKNRFYIGDPIKPTAVCVLGALYLGITGKANHVSGGGIAAGEFHRATGVNIVTASDKGMSIPDIAGILASEGY